MAHFQIKLLTPQVNMEDNTVAFLETTISEYYKQTDVENSKNEFLSEKMYTYCYTFDEKFSCHINGQKELSFSMTQNIWLDSEFTLNPFVSKIKNGTQILLIDQYNNEYFFTVKDIQYTLKESNVIYTYSCQDSFTYQHIRQNSGYTIDNNPETEDFIGAKPIDWWVTKKIIPECHISYTYLSLEDGLYLSKTTGNLVKFNKNEKLTDVEKIIKPIYLEDNKFYPQFKAYPEYYESFPFSISGGNASSALISLGEELGLMLNYKEQNIQENNQRSNIFIRYFWFEPKKHEETANLKYSPKINIQSLNLSHGGSSLTTVLNVESNQVNDELITLIPEIPPFFSTVFSSSTWEDSTFSDGFFTSMCQDKILLSENGQYSETGFNYSLDLKDHYIPGESFYDSEYLYLFLYDTQQKENNVTTKYLKIPEYYDKICLFDDEKSTEMFINDNYYSSKTSSMDFGLYEYDTETSTYKFVIYNNTYSTIPSAILDTLKSNCYLRIKFGFNLDSVPMISDSKVIVKFYRDATAEEIEFANIADSCPWLENRLIDFSYFLKQNIISSIEYKNLLDIIKNKLRIVNGKLLYYSNEYYRALQQKTTILANLYSTLDSLGAAFNSDVVEQYREKGFIEDPLYFKKAYEVYRSAYTQSNQKTPIINYEELLTEYLNKYIQAQQRFLKNIYYFKQYFNKKIETSSLENLYTAKKTIRFVEMNDSNKNPEIQIIEDEKGSYRIKRYLSFAQQPLFLPVDSNFSLYDSKFIPKTKIYNKDKITEAVVVTADNYKNFKTNKLHAGDWERCDTTSGYDSSKNYYRLLFVAPKNDITWPNTFTENNRKWYKYKEDESNIWYGNALPDAACSSLPNSIYYNELELKQDFVEVTYREIVNEYLYKQLYRNGNNAQLYYHNSDTLKDVSNWWKDDKISSEMLRFQPTIFYSIINQKTDKIESFKNFCAAVDKNQITTEDEKNEMIQYYKYKFPITDVTYKGPNYTENEYVWNNKKLTFQPSNRKGETYLEYKQYLIDTIINDKKLNYEIKDPFDVSEYSSYSIPIVNLDNHQNYFRRIKKPGRYMEDGRTLSIWSIFNVNENKKDLEWEWTDTSWETEGPNHKDFSGKPHSNTYRGYYDFDVVNYAKTASSFYEWDTLMKERQDARNEIAGIIISANATEEGYTTSTRYAADSEYYIHTKTHDKDFLDYFNYYSKIALTYNSAKKLLLGRNKKIQFEDKTLRVMTNNDKVDTTYNYRILSTNNLFKTGHTISDIIDSKQSFSAVLYYFLYQASTALDISDASGKDVSWGYYLGTNAQYNNYVFTTISPSMSFIILREEPFKEEPLFNTTDWEINSQNQVERLVFEKRYSLYQGEEVFNNLGVNQNFKSFPSLVEGLYKSRSVDAEFEQITDETTVVFTKESGATRDSRTKFFREKTGGTHERVYTIEQMKDLEEFYYISSDQYEANTISNVWNFKKLKIYYHQEYYIKNQNNEYVLSTNNEETFTKEAYCDFNFSPTNRSATIEYIDEYKRKFTRKCNLTSVEQELINNTTNGHFWYLYHNRSDCPQLFEKAAIIEAELTQYWQQAYSASLYCEYFLPPAWQPRTEGGVNYFADNIIKQERFKTEDSSGNVVFSTGEVKLLNKYLPEVSVYYNGSTTRLPKYSFQYKTDHNIENSTLASNELKDCIFFTDALKALNEDIDNIIITDYKNIISSEYGKVTYYYVANKNSGTKWHDLLRIHSKEPQVFDKYSGLYIMIYKTLKEQFTNRSFVEYETKKQEQTSLWNDLYKKFPGVLLEDNFSNQQATSSSELYMLATAAFKDKQEPEKNYNISLINAYNTLMVGTKEQNNVFWKKYQGQELRIGEGILIDTEEYCDNYDDIYKSLSQYLFITDISYNLRKDSDIQVTVNTIKYQDKLIQRLVKLIK